MLCACVQVERAVEILEDLQYKQSRQSLDSAYISLSAHCTILDTVMSCTNIQTKNTLCHYALYCQRDHASLFSSISTHPIKNCKFSLRSKALWDSRVIDNFAVSPLLCILQKPLSFKKKEDKSFESLLFQFEVNIASFMVTVKCHTVIFSIPLQVNLFTWVSFNLSYFVCVVVSCRQSQAEVFRCSPPLIHHTGKS